MVIMTLHLMGGFPLQMGIINNSFTFELLIRAWVLSLVTQPSTSSSLNMLCCIYCTLLGGGVGFYLFYNWGVFLWICEVCNKKGHLIIAYSVVLHICITELRLPISVWPCLVRFASHNSIFIFTIAKKWKWI